MVSYVVLIFYVQENSSSWNKFKKWKSWITMQLKVHIISPNHITIKSADNRLSKNYFILLENFIKYQEIFHLIALFYDIMLFLSLLYFQKLTVIDPKQRINYTFFSYVLLPKIST